MAIWSWSKTPATNATADITINMAEGMAPSAVNDSCRALMARVAEYRDDIAGTITTGGTSTAYTVTSNEVFDSLAHMNGAMIAFVPHTTNGATVTLNVDSLGAKPLRYGPSLELQTGSLIQGTPYVATYNNSDAVFYLQGGFANPYGIPLGGMMPYLNQSAAPNSAFAYPYGQAISRTTYATLFTLIGTAYGVGDGSTTFNIPDLRGRAIFGLGNMGGVNALRITAGAGNFDGSVLGNTGGLETHTITTAEMPVHSHGITDPGHSHSTTAALGGSGSLGGGVGNIGNAAIASDSKTTGITINNAGSGNAITILPPAIVLPYILRVI